MTETPSTLETSIDTSSDSQSSKSRKFSLFSRKQKPAEEQVRLVDKTEEQIQEERKKKDLIMKHRNMTEEEADKYLQAKQDGMNAERGLRAFGMALAPVRL